MEVTSDTTVRKGRRGLARKKASPTQDISLTITTTATVHDTSVYTSCVSRGYHSLLGDMSSIQDHNNMSGDSMSGIIGTTDTTYAPDHSDEAAESTGDKHQNKEICEYMEEEEYNYIPSSSGPDSLRSPTPPPSTSTIIQPKRRRMNKKLSSALRTLNMAKGNLESTPSTPFTKAKRKRGRRTCYTDIDTSAILLEDPSPLKKTEMLVKVRYLSNIHRLHLRITDPFHNLLAHLSRETGQEEQYLSLYLNDQVLPLSKTPREVGLTVADIIECFCMKDAKVNEFGKDSISLLIQCSNSKRKTEMNVTMRQPFKDILGKYAEQVGINASSYSLCFDGEDVGQNDTPLSLEMEDGDILDLVPASKAGARNRKAWQNSIITII